MVCYKEQFSYACVNFKVAKVYMSCQSSYRTRINAKLCLHVYLIQPFLLCRGRVSMQQFLTIHMTQTTIVHSHIISGIYFARMFNYKFNFT